MGGVAMGEHYSHLDGTERAAIMLLRRAGEGVRGIARKLHRDPATISREIRRQADHGRLPYEATRAEAQAFWQSRQSRNRRKLRPGNALFETVTRPLRQ